MSDKFYKSVIEKFPFGYVNLNVIRDAVGAPSDFEFKEVNAAFEQFTGITREEAVGMKLKAFLAEANLIQSGLFDALTHVTQLGGTQTLPHYYGPADAWYKFTAFSPEQGVAVVMFSDVSSIMRPHPELDVFFNIVPDLLLIVDKHGHIIKSNHALESILGYSAEELDNRLFLDFLHPDDFSDTVSITEQLSSESRDMQFVNRWKHKDGTSRYLEWIAKSDDDKIYAIGRDMTERIEYEKHIEYLSYHDMLTGLYNRRFLEEELQRLGVSRALPISVIMGDINRLKLVNDAFGHQKGDELIKTAADIIKSSCRPEDLVSRWGGDEFLILLPHTSAADAGKIVERINANCAGKQINSIDVSISFGISTKNASEESIFDVTREAENAMYISKSRDNERNRIDIIRTITETLYQKYPFEEKHAIRVGNLCRKTAMELGYDDENVQKITMAGLMHDIGKVAISLQILEKQTPLTDEEWTEIKKHSEIGCKIVGSAQEMMDIGSAILAHHERYDGNGYPRGIKWEDIPVAARIISIADSYDTMTKQSAYKRKMTKEEAVVEIRKNAGIQFDPGISEVFIKKVLRSA